MKCFCAGLGKSFTTISFLYMFFSIPEQKGRALLVVPANVLFNFYQVLLLKMWPQQLLHVKLYNSAVHIVVFSSSAIQCRKAYHAMHWGIAIEQDDMLLILLFGQVSTILSTASHAPSLSMQEFMRWLPGPDSPDYESSKLQRDKKVFIFYGTEVQCRITSACSGHRPWRKGVARRSWRAMDVQHCGNKGMRVAWLVELVLTYELNC